MPQDGWRENYISQNAPRRQVQMPQPSDWSGRSGLGERIQKSGPTHQAGRSVPGTNWVRCQRNFYLVYTIGRIKMRSNFVKTMFCFQITYVCFLKFFCCRFLCWWLNWFLCLNAHSGCDPLPYTLLSGPACLTTVWLTLTYMANKAHSDSYSDSSQREKLLKCVRKYKVLHECLRKTWNSKCVRLESPVHIKSTTENEGSEVHLLWG